MTEATVAEAQGTEIWSRLNWLRAGVLGANDGIVSTAALIFGVAGADAAHSTVVLAGIAAIAAGAMSMAVGEYVSVSSQRDLEESELARESRDIAADPSGQLQHLMDLLEGRGIDHELAERVAVELTERDAVGAHARLELGIDPAAVVNPWQAAFASLVAFTAGGLVPLLAMVLAPRPIAMWVSGAAVLVALGLSGAVSAGLGRTSYTVSIVRTMAGGLLAMAITYGIGRLAGTQL